jgi:N,N'-diacetylchitobiose phosphorylase
MAPCSQNDHAEVRHSEPYVYAQFIYGRDHEFYGRAENPWLTGTAGWMYTAATKFILGVRPDWGGLIVDPCIPHDWDGYAVTRQWRGATYHIHVTNPRHVSSGVVSVSVDGKPVEPRAQVGERPYALLPLEGSGKVFDVVIELG